MFLYIIFVYSSYLFDYTATLFSHVNNINDLLFYFVLFDKANSALLCHENRISRNCNKESDIPANTYVLYDKFYTTSAPNVFDVGSTLNKCYTNILCLLSAVFRYLMIW